MARDGIPRCAESSQQSCSQYPFVIRSPNPQSTLSQDPFLVRARAPLELLSPLSVVRILLGLNIATWVLATLFLHTPSVRVPAVASIIASAVLTWLILEVVHRLDARWLVVLLAVSSVQIALLTWAGSGTAATYVYLLSAIPVGITAALFVSYRALLGQQLVSVIGLILGLATALGFVRGAVVGLVVGLVDLSTSITVCFLTHTSRRHRSFDNDTGLPNGVGLSQRVGQSTRRPSFVVAVIRLEGIADARGALGYEVGTELLKRAVEDLGQVLPPATFIGRVDGDELVVTLGLGLGKPEQRDAQCRRGSSRRAGADPGWCGERWQVPRRRNRGLSPGSHRLGDSPLGWNRSP